MAGGSDDERSSLLERHAANLFRGLRMDLAIDEDVNVSAGKSLVPTYLCPSADHVYGLKKAPHSLPLADPIEVTPGRRNPD